MLLLKKLPIFIILLIATAVMMFVPSIFGLISNDFGAARSFFYYGLLILLISIFLAFASLNRGRSSPMRSQLLIVIVSFPFLPILFMLPLTKLLPNLTISTLYFEMVSAFTTTGLTELFAVKGVSKTVLFWQVLVGWFGGLFIWTLYLSIFLPLGLNNIALNDNERLKFGVRSMDLNEQHHSEIFISSLVAIFIPYFILTIILWVVLKLLGASTFDSMSHAMSTMATSGISPNGTLNSEANQFSFIFISLFLLFAVSSNSYKFFSLRDMKTVITNNTEFHTGIMLILISSLFLFFMNLNNSIDFYESLKFLLQSIFITISFLTTTGWFIESAMDLSNDTVIIVLIILTVIGGGIGSTAGGLKLIRFFILKNHLFSETTKMVYPSQVRILTSRMSFNSSVILKVWVFTMILLIAIALICSLLTFSGISLRDAIVLSISVLCNNGPLYSTIIQPLDLSTNINSFAKFILILGMILGRIEILVIFALINPEFWRK